MKSRICRLMIVAFAVQGFAFGAASTAQAYRGFVGFGPSYSCGGYYGGYRSYYGYGYNYRPYINVYPTYPAYTYTRPVVVVPRIVTYPSVTYPSIPTNVVTTVEAPAQVPQQTTNGILIRNLADNQSDVRFLLGSRQVSSLTPGTSQRLMEPWHHSIRFDRGNGNGEAAYRLEDGTYAFVATNNGWELYRQSFTLTIDNSTNQNAFTYVVDNQHMFVPAGQSRTTTSIFPMDVRFDRGNSQIASKNFGSENTIVSVAVNPADGLLDLFAPGTGPTMPTNSIATNSIPTNPIQSASSQTPMNAISPPINGNGSAANTAPLMPTNNSGSLAQRVPIGS